MIYKFMKEEDMLEDNIFNIMNIYFVNKYILDVLYKNGIPKTSILDDSNYIMIFEDGYVYLDEISLSIRKLNIIDIVYIAEKE